METRILWWNIHDFPHYKEIFYTLFYISVIFFLYGFYLKIKKWSTGKPKNNFNNIPGRIKNMFDRSFQALIDDGHPYNGVMYKGLMLVTRKGRLTVIQLEDNARWGDPEAEVLLPLKSNLLDLSIAAAQGNDLGDFQLELAAKSRVAVTIASRGYPGDYKWVNDKEIFGVDEVRNLPKVRLYGAGIRADEVAKGRYRYFANGGRLLYVVGEGQDVLEARKNAYGAASLIYVEGNNGHYRRDIGIRDVARIYEAG